MKRKRLALVLAAAMLVTSVPTNGLTGYQEVSAEEFLFDDGTADAFDDGSVVSLPESAEENTEEAKDSKEASAAEEELLDVNGQMEEKSDEALSGEEFPIEEIPEEAASEKEEAGDESSEEVLFVEEEPEFSAAGNTNQEATPIAVGGRYAVADAVCQDSYYWFSFAPEETGDYGLYVQNSDGIDWAHVELYEDIDGTLEYIDYRYIYNDTMFTYSLTEGITYYYHVSDTIPDTSDVCLEKIPAVIGLEIILPEPLPICVSGIDNYPPGTKVKYTYENGTEQTVSISSNDKYGYFAGYNLFSINEDGTRGDYVPNTGTLSGTYMLYVACGDVSAEAEITFRTPSDKAEENTLTLNGEFSFIDDGSVVGAVFTPDHDGTYVFHTTAFVCDLQVYDENGALVAGTGYNKLKTNLTAGQKYSVLYKNSYSENEQINLSVYEYVPVTDIRFESDELQVSAFTLSDYFSSIPVTLEYGNGTTEEISSWGMYGDGYDFAGAKVDGNEQQLKLRMYDETGSEEVGLPLYGTAACGTYMLKALYSFNHETVFEKSIKLTVSSVPESAEELTVGESVSADGLAYLEKRWYRFQPAKAGKYKASMPENNGCDITCYKITADGVIDTCNEVFEPENDETYVICTTSYADGDGNYTLIVKEYADATDVRLVSDELEISPLEITGYLQNLPVTVEYENDTMTTISDWYVGYDGYYYLFTSDEEYITVRMYDESGSEEAGVPVWDQIPVVGTYTLKVSYFSADGTVIEKSVPLTIGGLPENTEELTVGQKVSVTDLAYREKKWYVFKPSVAGKYKLELEDSDGIYGPDVYQMTADGGFERNYEPYLEYKSEEANETYVVCIDSYWDGAYYTLDVEKVKIVNSIKLVSVPENAVIIKGLDDISSVADNLKVEFTYDDGSTKQLNMYGSDIDGNSVTPLLYKKEAGEALDPKDLVNVHSTIKLTSGVYMCVISVRNWNEGYTDIWTEFPVTVMSKQEAAARNILLENSEGLDIKYAGGSHVCVQFTPESDGDYAITSNVRITEFKVYNSSGRIVELNKNDTYEHTVTLQKGEAYILALHPAYDTKDFHLTAESLSKVNAVSLSSKKQEFIAGLDTLELSELSLGISYADDTYMNLNGEKAESGDAYGNKFRYEITSQETGESDYLDTPLGYWSGSYISLTTGSFINGAVRRTGSSISMDIGTYLLKVVHKTMSSIVSNAVTLHSVGLDAEELPKITENEEFVLNASEARQLFSFTPSSDGRYRFASESGLNWNVYEQRSTGLVKASKTLEAGQTYVICIQQVPSQQTVKLYNQEITQVVLGQSTDIKADPGDWEEFIFTPESDGGYVITVEAVTCEEDNYIYLKNTNNGISVKEYGKKISLPSWLEAGTTYSLRFASDCPDGGTYRILVTETKQLAGIKIVPKTTELSWFFEENMDAYVDIMLQYQDGSSEKMLEDFDAYGNYIYWWTSVASDSITIYAECGDFSDSITMPCSSDTSDFTVISEDTVYKTIGGKGLSYYLFTPETTGTYVLNADVGYSDNGFVAYYDTAEAIQRYGVYWSNHSHGWMDAGTTYVIGMPQSDTEASYDFSISKHKAITGMKLKTPEEPFVPETEAPAGTMTAIVTYEDGTTAEISITDEYDAYGNSIGWSYIRLNSQKVRVYLFCEEYRVYCDVESRVGCIDGHTGDTVEKTIIPATCTESGIAGVFCVNCGEKLSEKEIPALGHQYEKTVLTEATCTADGQNYYRCINNGCDDSYFETVKAQGHQFGEELTQEATETEYGKVYRICSVCGEEEIIRKLIPTKVEQQIDEAISMMKTEDESGTVDVNQVLETVSSIDNQSLIDSGDKGTELVNSLEEKLIQENEQIKETVCSGDITEKVSVQGAGVTVASVLKNEDIDETAVYSAEISVNKVSEDSTSYKVEISIAIVNDKNDSTIVPEALDAPLTITIPIPAHYVNGRYHLYHITGDERVSIDYTEDTENGTITFRTPSLSPFETVLEECGTHTMEQTVVTEAACDQIGTIKNTCSVCGYEEISYSERLPHEYEETVIAAPTCTLAGKSSFTCVNCGDTYEAETGALGHSFTNYVSDNNATCTEDGTKTAKCDRCGVKSTVADTGSALGHSFTNYVSDGNATCTADGTKTAKCDRCDVKSTVADTGSALGHSVVKDAAVAATCTTAGKTEGSHCSRCGVVLKAQTAVKALGHSFTKYVSNGDATALKDGTKTAKCDRCTVTNTVTDKGSKLKATIKVSASSLPLKKGQKLKNFKVTMAKGDYVKSWKSSNTKIVKVSGKKNGTCTITAQKKTGTAKITITLASGKKKTVTVKVQKTAVKTTKISGLKKSVTLKKGKKLTLAPVITPISSTQKVTYTSSNKKVATVTSKGVIKGVKAGTAKITVKSGSKKYVVTVKVKK